MDTGAFDRFVRLLGAPGPAAGSLARCLGPR
jgi:hypothetical protein